MFKNIISYLAHSVCFCIIISALAVMTYSMYKNNLISVYSKFEAEASHTVNLSDERATSVAASIADMKACYELKLKQEKEQQQIEEAASTENNEQQKEEAKTVSSAYATLYIDRIGMEVPIYYGDDSKTLRKGPGQYPGSSLPGEGSQILIAGHNTTHFKPLQNVAVGDIIRVVTGYGEFHYQVISTKIASMNDTSTYNLSLDHEQLVLYTCYPFTGPPGKTQRFFVYADLIN